MRSRIVCGIGALLSALMLGGLLGWAAEAPRLMVSGQFQSLDQARTAWKFSDSQGRDLWIDRDGQPTQALAPPPDAARPSGFARAHRYAGSYAAVIVGDACGYVDAAGQLHKERFQACGDFAEGLAKVVTTAGQATYIDTALHPVHAGMPAAEDKAGLWFADGLAPMREAKTLLWGYIDAQGAWKIPPRFQSAGSFSEGLAPVEALDAHDRFRLGFIDLTGSLVITPQFGPQSATGHWVQFADGRAIVADPARFPRSSAVESPQDAWYGVIDRSGRWVSTLRFQSCGPCVYDNGRAALLDPEQMLINRGAHPVWRAGRAP